MIPLQLFLIAIQWIFNDYTIAEVDNPPFQKFESGMIKGIITDTMLAEASGIAASATNPGYFWVINDSGNSPAIYLIDSLGNVTRQYILSNIQNIDWEDIVVIRGENDRYQLIVADIGDNFSVRPFIQLLVLDEPSLGLKTDSLLDNYQTHRFVFEDSARDAEAILADPVRNEIFIISKRESMVGIYKVPDLHEQSTPDTLRLACRLPFNNITAGSISRNGRDIVIKNYNAIFYWSRVGNTSILETLQLPHQPVEYIVEPQGESITWNQEGTGFYTLSELSYADKQQFYLYKKKK